MCYMPHNEEPAPASARRRRPASQVGVRELRQNLSVYLDRVIAGESLEVASRGEVVALLIPVPPPRSTVERLVASGRALAATRSATSIPDAPPARVSPGQRTRIWAALDASRDDRF